MSEPMFGFGSSGGRISRGALSAAMLAVVIVFAACGGEIREPVGPDWPRWRGPSGDGISVEAEWDPAAIAGGPVTAWTFEAGAGFSSPSIVDGYVYLMGNAKGEDTVYCLRAADGKLVWSHSYPCRAGEYPGPTSTPTVDRGTVFCLSKEGLLNALDAADGKVLWSRHIASDFGAVPPEWGFASSVVPYGESLLVNAGEAGMALDRTDGSLIWASAPKPSGYASPVLMLRESETVALFFGAGALFGVDPDSGSVLWSHPWKTAYDVNAADPLVVGDRIFITTGYGRGCALLEVNGGEAAVVWENRTVSSHFGSPVSVDGFIYANDGDAGAHRGSFVCLDPLTGESRWSERLGLGSMISTPGRLILLTERRELIIAETSPEEFVEIARCSLPRGLYWTPPVISGGRIYVRSISGTVTCIDVSG